MDCEGSELLIFSNAGDILQKQGPQIFCGVHHEYLQDLGQSVEDIVQLLGSLGYTVKPIQVENLDAPSDFATCSHIYAAQHEKSCRGGVDFNAETE